MNTPLFGEESQAQKISTYIVGIGVFAFVIETIIVVIVKGISNQQYFPLAVLIILMCLPPVVLYRWFKMEDLENRYLYLVFVIMFTIALACICANIIVFCCPPPVPVTCASGSLLNTATQKCIGTCSCDPLDCNNCQCGLYYNNSLIGCTFGANCTNLCFQTFNTSTGNQSVLATGSLTSMFFEGGSDFDLKQLDLLKKYSRSANENIESTQDQEKSSKYKEQTDSVEETGRRR